RPLLLAPVRPEPAPAVRPRPGPPALPGRRAAVLVAGGRPRSLPLAPAPHRPAGVRVPDGALPRLPRGGDHEQREGPGPDPGELPAQLGPDPPGRPADRRGHPVGRRRPDRHRRRPGRAHLLGQPRGEGGGRPRGPPPGSCPPRPPARTSRQPPPLAVSEREDPTGRAPGGRGGDAAPPDPLPQP